MKIWIIGGGYLTSWMREHFEAAGHDVYLSSWDPTERHQRDWVEVLRSSFADLVINAYDLPSEIGCRRNPVLAGAAAGSAAVIAQACRETSTPLVYLSSSEAAVGGGLYGQAKLFAEQAGRLYAAPSGYQIVRLYGVYGPGHYAPHEIPEPAKIVLRAQRDHVLYAHRDVYRGWCYVTDAVRALRLIVEDGRAGVWNIGRWDNEVTMFELAEMACTVVGVDPGRVVGAPLPAAVPQRKTPDTAALLSLGWEPRVALEKGLQATAAWLRSQTTNTDAAVLGQ